LLTIIFVHTVGVTCIYFGPLCLSGV